MSVLTYISCRTLAGEVVNDFHNWAEKEQLWSDDTAHLPDARPSSHGHVFDVTVAS